MIDFSDFTKNVAKGACFLGSGGGGNYSSACELLGYYNKHDFPDISEKEPLKVIMPEDATVGHAVVLAFLGSPEKLENVGAEAIKTAIAAVKEQRHILEQQGKTLRYLIPAEVGAVNSIIPCIVAHYLGLTVIDGDGAGRAIPTLKVSSFTAEDINPLPCVFTDHNGYSITLNAREGRVINSISIAEQLARPVVSTDEFAGYAGLALWPISHEQIVHGVRISGSLSCAEKLGGFLNYGSCEGREFKISSVTEILTHINSGKVDSGSYKLKGKLLFSGNLESASVSTGAGFDYGSVVIKGQNVSYTGIFQNETLLCWSSDSESPLAMAPDSIAYLIEDSQQVYSNGDLIDSKTGQLDEDLVGVKCHVIRFSAQSAMMCQTVVDEFGKIINRMGFYGKLKV